MFLWTFFKLGDDDRQRKAALEADDRASDAETEHRDRLGRTIGRFFGLVWLIYLLDIHTVFHDQHFTTPESIAAWSGLGLFAGSYVTIMVIVPPLWVRRHERHVAISRLLVGAMTVVNTAFALTIRQTDFGFVYIYAAVCAGMYLERKESMRIILGLTVLAVGAGFYSSASAEDIATSALLVGGIGMNTVFWCALMLQNRELRRARAEITRLAISEERLRFARDLHDLLGHSLSVIALKSELAGRLLEKYPDRAASEIVDVERVARTALQEVRDAVTGYRKPSLDEELNNAAQMLRAAGTKVRINADTESLPTEIDRVLAWFVREGTTNVIRHAGMTAVTIVISQTAHEVYAEMTDAGRPNASMPSPPRSGRETGAGGSGLVGLGERIRACGGEFTSGPLPGGGFRLYARVPIDTTKADSADEPVPTAEPRATFSPARIGGATT